MFKRESQLFRSTPEAVRALCVDRRYPSFEHILEAAISSIIAMLNVVNDAD